MAGYLIAETTREEREKIVAESLGNIEANCDGCMAGLAEMYQEYIDGTVDCWYFIAFCHFFFCRQGRAF